MFPSRAGKVLLVAAVAGVAVAAPLSTVTLDYGTFTGLTDATNEIVYFRGVKFADAPVGALRWQAPVSPPTMHLGNVNATQYAAECIATTQTTTSSTTAEDCLFINVFIPIATTATSALPVLVYFHGGGFEGGTAAGAPPENIIQNSAKPLIFATVQYRLGQFGFLGGTPVANNGALNAGLLDQKAALVWIQRYISKFGGDPRRVTIWGESAGAGSTMFHLVGNDGANGNLFHQAMGDSPSLSFLPHYTDSFVEDLFTQFAGFAGCGSSGTGDAIMACLRAAPVNTIASAGSKILGNRTSSLYPLAPIADGKFIATRPVEAFKSGLFARVPVLFGSNTNEGAHWSAGLANPAANTSEANATETTVYNFITGQFSTFTRASFDKAIAELYPLADYNNSFSLQGQQMYGEMRYICSAVLIAGAAHDFGLPAYQYHWDNPTLSSDHGADLNAFFDGTRTFDADDQAIVNAMRGYFTSFVTDGTPVAANAITWPSAVDSNGSPRIFLHPGDLSLENVTEALSERCAFWHGLSGEIST
ncbi:Alpha/Beta hydrolase protein [Roridomyces roridus]|uniref:Carboxylic ester hydrolase n=1 Tax=Roridomyces roridus TaxID=1738132 RepID=A0AAD7FG80_9AGAR|nr:Alpha/Beta hydrolase protein [Roridomyces roridus]